MASVFNRCKTITGIRRNAFPADYRLRQSDDFRAVFEHGKRYVRAGVVVIVAPGRHNGARLGLAIAKRRVPRAVDRNRIKRLVRESFRIARCTLGSVDIVVLARSGTAGLNNRRLAAQLRSIWYQANDTDTAST